MIPKDFLYEDENYDNENSKEPDKIWKVSSTRIQGFTDGLSAVAQSIKKRLDTEAEIYEIYGNEYGLKTFDLIGKDINYSILTLKRRIAESVLNDERTTNVKFLAAEAIERRIKLSFEIVSIYGTFEMERVVKV